MRSTRPTRRRGLAILIALAILIPIAAAPVEALTLQRTWGAKVGTNGTITVRAYTNGVGSATYNLRGLRANATYIVQVRKGT